MPRRSLSMGTNTRIPKLTITVGLPASGKTTWAVEHQTGEFRRTGRLVARLNRDLFRVALHGAAIYTEEQEWQVTLVQTAAAEALLREGVDVVADDTNLRPQYVQRWQGLADRCGAALHVEDMFLAVPVDECVRRDAKRPEGQRVGEKVIREMHDRYLVEMTATEPTRFP
jgi:predicted kinase